MDTVWQDIWYQVKIKYWWELHAKTAGRNMARILIKELLRPNPYLEYLEDQINRYQEENS